MRKISFQLFAFFAIALVCGVSHSQVRDADAYKPINEIRSIDSLSSGARSQTRAEADRFLRALTELTIVRPFPLKLNDGVTVWRVTRYDDRTFYIRITDTPFFDWKTFAARFHARSVLSPHWSIYENDGPYFLTRLDVAGHCVSTFIIKVQ